MFTLAKIGYRRNQVKWRLTEWEVNQLKHCDLFARGIPCALPAEEIKHDVEWRNLTTRHGNRV